MARHAARIHAMTPEAPAGAVRAPSPGLSPVKPRVSSSSTPELRYLSHQPQRLAVGGDHRSASRPGPSPPVAAGCPAPPVTGVSSVGTPTPVAPPAGERRSSLTTPLRRALSPFRKSRPPSQADQASGTAPTGPARHERRPPPSAWSQAVLPSGLPALTQHDAAAHTDVPGRKSLSSLFGRGRAKPASEHHGVHEAPLPMTPPALISLSSGQLPRPQSGHTGSVDSAATVSATSTACCTASSCPTTDESTTSPLPSNDGSPAAAHGRSNDSDGDSSSTKLSPPAAAAPTVSWDDKTVGEGSLTLDGMMAPHLHSAWGSKIQSPLGLDISGQLPKLSYPEMPDADPIGHTPQPRSQPHGLDLPTCFPSSPPSRARCSSSTRPPDSSPHTRNALNVHTGPGNSPDQFVNLDLAGHSVIPCSHPVVRPCSGAIATLEPTSPKRPAPGSTNNCDIQVPVLPHEGRCRYVTSPVEESPPTAGSQIRREHDLLAQNFSINWSRPLSQLDVSACAADGVGREAEAVPAVTAIPIAGDTGLSTDDVEAGKSAFVLSPVSVQPDRLATLAPMPVLSNAELLKAGAQSNPKAAQTAVPPSSPVSRSLSQSLLLPQINGHRSDVAGNRSPRSVVSSPSLFWDSTSRPDSLRHETIEAPTGAAECSPSCTPESSSSNEHDSMQAPAANLQVVAAVATQSPEPLRTNPRPFRVLSTSPTLAPTASLVRPERLRRLEKPATDLMAQQLLPTKENALPAHAWGTIEMALLKFRGASKGQPPKDLSRGKILRLVLQPFLDMEHDRPLVRSDATSPSGVPLPDPVYEHYNLPQARRGILYEWVHELLRAIRTCASSAERLAILESIAMLLETRNLSPCMVDAATKDPATGTSYLGILYECLAYAITELNKKGVYHNNLVFAGRIIALSLFRIPGVGIKLLMALPVRKASLKYVTREARWTETAPVGEGWESYLACFPDHLRPLCFLDSTSYDTIVSAQPTLGEEVEHNTVMHMSTYLVQHNGSGIKMGGYWLRRWQSDDSEVVFSFYRNFHRQLERLVRTCLPCGAHHLYFGAPGYAHVAASVQQKCLALVHRSINAVTTHSNRGFLCVPTGLFVCATIWKTNTDPAGTWERQPTCFLVARQGSPKNSRLQLFAA